ncbi:MAG: hypothetical protein ABIQ86_08225 [Steroidobacteraceae bacterium]
MRKCLLLVLALGLLGACTRVNVFGHPVKDVPAPAAQAATAITQPGQQITRFALEYTPAAQKQVNDDERFNAEALRDAITAELRSRQLLDLQRPGGARVAVIQLDEFEVRATSNVVMFGRVSSAGVLAGAIRISGAASGDEKKFRVGAEVPMRVATSGADKNPLQNLYKEFAKQLADELTGVAPRQPQRP